MLYPPRAIFFTAVYYPPFLPSLSSRSHFFGLGLRHFFSHLPRPFSICNRPTAKEENRYHGQSDKREGKILILIYILLEKLEIQVQVLD